MFMSYRYRIDGVKSLVRVQNNFTPFFTMENFCSDHLHSQFVQRQRSLGWPLRWVRDQVSQEVEGDLHTGGCISALCQKRAPPLRLPNRISLRSRQLLELSIEASRSQGNYQGRQRYGKNRFGNCWEFQIHAPRASKKRQGAQKVNTAGKVQENCISGEWRISIA